MEVSFLKLLQNPPKYATHTKKLKRRRNVCKDKLKKLEGDGGGGGGGSGETSVVQTHSQTLNSQSDV